MTDHQTTALVSRQAAGLAPSVPAQALAGNGGVALTEAIQVANALSKAGPLIPAPYRDQPGAVLAVLMWSQANGVDPFTAMLNIHLIDERKDGNPKPFVSAEMRVELASRKGFDFRVTHSDREACTIEVWRGTEKRGEWTSRITDVPEEKFSIDRATGKPKKRKGKNNTTYADLEDPEPERDDVLDVLSGPQADPEPWDDPGPLVADDGLAAEPEFHVSSDEEAADDLTAPPPEPVTEAQLRKLGVTKVLRAAKDLGHDIALIGDVAKDQALARQITETLA